MKTLCAFFLAAASASAGPSQTTASSENWAREDAALAILGAHRKQSKNARAHHTIPAPSRQNPILGGKDKPSDSARLPDNAFPCGLFGELCPKASSVEPAGAANLSPLNTGFAALGLAGKTGKVDGPGRQGNGSYRVDKNDPFEMSLTIKTGYIDGQITLKRDPQTGKDSARYAGRHWENDQWGEYTDKTNDAELRYDPGEDKGSIRWKENGSQKSEGYWGGKGGNSMTIEFGGGWDHDFKQD